MNEFVITVGVNDSSRVKWSRVISWTKNERLKTDVADYIRNQDSLNIHLLSSYLKTSLKRFERRDFEEFNYLTVEPPAYVIWIVWIVCVLMNIGMGLWITRNDFDDESE